MTSTRPVQNGSQSLFSFVVVGVFCLALAPLARPQANSSGPAAGSPPASTSTPHEAAPANTPPPSAPTAAAVPSVRLPSNDAGQGASDRQGFGAGAGILTAFAAFGAPKQPQRLISF